MIKQFSSLVFFMLTTFAIGQQKTNLYLLPGLGADCRLFALLEIDTSKYTPICLAYQTPNENQSMESFARQISAYIDTTRSFSLIGASLGGMLATEIAHTLSPEKVIIISSAKHSGELPLRYTFQRLIPLHKVIPPKLIKKGALVAQPIVEPDRNKYESVFISMLSNKEALYFTRTIDLIVNWERKSCEVDIIHIHGGKDHTIPIRRVDNPITLKNGSHMITLCVMLTAKNH